MGMLIIIRPIFYFNINIFLISYDSINFNHLTSALVKINPHIVRRNCDSIWKINSKFIR